jgi:hypothetical protein
MQKLKTFLTVIGAVTILVLAANSAVYAATGGKFILGQTNKAGKVSTLQRTKSGPALNLVTKSSAAAPMTVNGKGKVTNLNADTVDGLDSSALRTGTYVFTRTVSSPTTEVDISLHLPAGTYNLGYAAYMVGGGVDNGSAGCYFYREVNGTDDTYFGETAVLTKAAVYPSLSGVGTVTVGGAGVTLNLYCWSEHSFTTSSAEPIQVTATRTIVLTGASASRVAPSARTGRPFSSRKNRW